MKDKSNILNHIQTLRAFSVLIVFLYHTNIGIYSNGYLGVDIFFLISGFVISKKIFEDYKEKGKIDLKNFYSKRIKRIVPNLIFIVSVTYLFYLLFGPPDLSLFRETLFALLGLSNLYYINYSRDYFNNVFEDPLGHTWSLGVEEQFYLIFPLIIFLFFKIKQNNFIQLKISLLIVFLISLAFFSLNYKDNQLYSFYFSPLRFWEFLMGTFFYLYKEIFKFNKIIFISSIIGILIIIFSGQNIVVNYYKNIIILIFSGYIISSYRKNFIFENRLSVYLGNMSYSFYLWHLPILFFSDLYITSKMNIDLIFAFFLTIFLSIVTYTFIEQKFRYLKWKFSYFIILFFFGVSILLGSIYIKYFNDSLRADIRNFVYDLNYLEKRYNWNDRVIFTKNLKIGTFQVYNHCREGSSNFTINTLKLRKECLQQKDFSKIFFLFGNSHSVQFLPLLTNTEEMKNIYFLHLTKYGFPSENIINILDNNYEEVYLLTNITNLENFYKIKDNYEKIKNKKIKLILFNSTPNPTRNEPFKCLIQQIDCFIDKNESIKKRDLDKLFKIIFDYQKNNKKDVFVFNSFDFLCKKNNKCTIYDKESDTLIFRDGSHIIYEGAKTLFDDFKNFLLENRLIY